MNKLCYPCNIPFQVSQKWGENYDYYFKNFKENGHNGWDFSIPVGTPIYATHDGTVFFRGIDVTGSLAISLDSLDGSLRTIYGHLSEFKCNNGDKIKKGQLIALSGNTGRYTTGPHLHFGVHPISNYQDVDKNNGWNGAVDPALYWDGTYPSNYVTEIVKDDTPFVKMQKAILEFQISEGITVFKNKPLKAVRFGPNTLTKATKYY